ncbi:MAG TPA: L,D-transpeptidase family protein [Candidatus Binataceae bacterium]|nr:L,D-transpeptidase family protein [Candidatus Binataceae bacterium]
MKSKLVALIAVVVSVIALGGAKVWAHKWSESEFENRPLFAYPIPQGRDDIIGSLTTYKIQPGDTLLDIGRWFGLSAKEVSDANNHMDWWLPPVGQVIVLPTEHILPSGPRSGITMNIPEMRLYYYYPPPVAPHRHHGKVMPISYSVGRVVYTFPVGLGRFDWKTPIGDWHVTRKVKDPPWVLPADIYQEHLERDGYAEHVIPGGAPDNPEGHFLLELSIPEYGLHGTDVPWGVGMTVSHGCVRLYPEDIERLYAKTPVGTPGRFTYQPVKFGWRGAALYVEVHDDLYGKYPGMWNLASKIVSAEGLSAAIDNNKLEKAIELKSGIPTYVGLGEDPSGAPIPFGGGTGTAGNPPPPVAETASSSAPPAADTTTSYAPAPAGDSSGYPPAPAADAPNYPPSGDTPRYAPPATPDTSNYAPPSTGDTTSNPPPAIADPANAAPPPSDSGSGNYRIPSGGGIKADSSGIE